MSELRALIDNPTTAELELVARYAALRKDPRRDRAFEAFAASGLPHRRMEMWRWTDFRAGLKSLEVPAHAGAIDPFAGLPGAQFTFGATKVGLPADLPAGITLHKRDEPPALSDSEEIPLGALTAALVQKAGRLNTLVIEVTEAVAAPVRFVFTGEGAEASFARVVILVRPGASLDLVESQLGGAGLSSSLFRFDVKAGGRLSRTLYQAGGGDESQVITTTVHLDEGAAYDQTMLAFGAGISRLETRVVHQEEGADVRLDAAYLAGRDRHVDVTTHVRHGAAGCTTAQLTKGAVVDGGRGVFQGKFLVARVGQGTQADMQHHALLLANGAEVNARPELEIYADDVACAHGNTCGAMDEAALFYMRQRGLPEAEARALLTEAFVAEALAGAHPAAGEIMLETARKWLAEND